jgi:hypothetical protein
MILVNLYSRLQCIPLACSGWRKIAGFDLGIPQCCFLLALLFFSFALFIVLVSYGGQLQSKALMED